MKKIIILLKGYKKYSVVCFIATFFQVICYLEIPLLIAKILNEGVYAQDKTAIVNNGLKMLLLAVLAMFFGVICVVTATKASQGFGSNARKLLFDKILALSTKNIDDFSDSSLITRLSSDTIALQKAYYTIGYQLLYAMLMVIFSLIYLIRINLKLALLIAITVVLFLVCVAIILAFGLPKFSELQKETEKLNTVIRENTISQRVVKAFGRQDVEQAKLNQSNTKLTKILTSALGSFLLLFPFSNLLMYVGIILILWVGGKMTGDGTLGFGDLSSSLSYSFQIFGSLITFSTALSEIGRAIVALKRIFKVVETEPAITDTGTIEKLTHETINFKDVSFSYTDEGGTEVLSKIDLSVPNAQFLGIVGSTGEGKSTLVKLLLRLYDPSKGQIFLNGSESNAYSLKSLRNSMSVVFQDNMLFSGTIKSNIKWGNPMASDEAVIEACKDAQAHEFIMSMPEQYDTWIEQGGTNVSGGQRQRLCIARALLKNSSIFIFDDCMSALDTITEGKIQKIIGMKYKHSTILMISQKISSVRNADKIIVLDGGKVAGCGNHETLLLENNIYQQIYASQN